MFICSVPVKQWNKYKKNECVSNTVSTMHCSLLCEFLLGHACEIILMSLYGTLGNNESIS